jgi:hypothetical protein
MHVKALKICMGAAKALIDGSIKKYLSKGSKHFHFP